jgi:hypothetical protein
MKQIYSKESYNLCLTVLRNHACHTMFLFIDSTFQMCDGIKKYHQIEDERLSEPIDQGSRQIAESSVESFTQAFLWDTYFAALRSIYFSGPTSENENAHERFSEVGERQ